MRNPLHRSPPAIWSGAFSTITSEFRRPRRLAATCVGSRLVRNLRHRSGYLLVSGNVSKRRIRRSCADRGTGSAPIGAEMFKNERRKHFRTRVYGELCIRFAVDTSSPVDKMKKVEKGFKNERFDVSVNFTDAWPAESAPTGECDRSPAGDARPGWTLWSAPRRPRNSSPSPSRDRTKIAYLPGRPNETRLDPWRSQLAPCFVGPLRFVAGAADSRRARSVCARLSPAGHMSRSTRSGNGRHIPCRTDPIWDGKTARLRKILRSGRGKRR
jgi:hypothetical protein